jgi:hypothetical protein
MKTAGIDVIRVVWSQDYDPLTVAPSADCPGYVTVEPRGADAESFWGKFSITMPKELALQLAEAIRACAEEQDD